MRGQSQQRSKIKSEETAPAADGRAAILDAVLRLARDTEVTDINLTDICQAAGVTSGAIYFHFSNKNDAVEAAIIREIGRKYEAVADLPEDADIQTLIRAILDATSRRHRADRKVAKAIQILINTRPNAYDAWLDGRQPVIQRLHRAIAEARRERNLPEGPSQYLARVVLNSIENLAMDVFQWRNPNLTAFAGSPDEWNRRQLELWSWAILAPVDEGALAAAAHEPPRPSD